MCQKHNLYIISTRTTKFHTPTNQTKKRFKVGETKFLRFGMACLPPIHRSGTVLRPHPQLRLLLGEEWPGGGCWVGCLCFFEAGQVYLYYGVGGISGNRFCFGEFLRQFVLRKGIFGYNLEKNHYQNDEQKSYETCTKSQLLHCRIYSYEKSEAYHWRIEWSYCYGSDVTNTLIDHLSSRHGPLYNWLSFSVLMVDGPMGKMIILACLESWGSHVPIMKATLLIWCDMMWDKKRCDTIWYERQDPIRYDVR